MYKASSGQSSYVLEGRISLSQANFFYQVFSMEDIQQTHIIFLHVTIATRGSQLSNYGHSINILEMTK